MTFVGAMLGLGIAMVLRGLLPARAAVADTVQRYEQTVERPRREVVSEARTKRPVLTSIGEALSSAAERIGSPLARTEDLSVLARSRDSYLASTGLSAVGLAAIGAVAASLLPRLGLRLPAVAAVATAVCGGLVGVIVPAVELRRAAERERTYFLRGLSCWLELVAMAQAGGMGVESALQSSSEISHDRTFLRLRRALERAHLAGTPWQALGQLGKDLGIAELEELASTLSLAGTEGARVRSSLVAKSASLRRRQMAEAEAEANATTERLFLPSVVLMIAFMIFLMYPAGERLAHVF